jgi:hypothetical protein
MGRIDKDTFLRSFKVLSNQSFDMFLGAGASISSGIHRAVIGLAVQKRVTKCKW